MIEAALLTGGRSQRMGQDKASLSIGGEAQAKRIVRLLTEVGIPVTVLGKKPIECAAFLPDDETVESPLDALRRFKPSAELVFILSCDLPRFDSKLVSILNDRLGDFEAVAPFVDGFRQPMVALYRASAFENIPDEGCPNTWLRQLNARLVDEEELLAAGIDPDVTRGANTPEEFASLVGITS